MRPSNPTVELATEEATSSIVVPMLGSDFGQVVHTHVGLSSNSTIWYQSQSAAGKVTVGLALHWQ